MLDPYFLVISSKFSLIISVVNSGINAPVPIPPVVTSSTITAWDWLESGDFHIKNPKPGVPLPFLGVITTPQDFQG